MGRCAAGVRAVDSVEELRAALEDPDGLLLALGKAATPAARRVIATLRPILTPLLDKWAWHGRT